MTTAAGLFHVRRGIFLGKHEVALKMYGYSSDGIENRRLRREMEIWKELRHPCVLPFIGQYTVGSRAYLVSPWMENGESRAFVQNNPDTNRVRFLAQVAEGLHYLHSRNPAVVHGGLTGANILVSAAGDAVISDFGIAEAMFADSQGLHSTGWLNAGNARWQAPELLLAETEEQACRTTSSDMFAFGRVMLEIFTGQIPFRDVVNLTAVVLLVVKGNNPDRPSDLMCVKRGLDDRMWEFVTRCWSEEPSLRPTADEAVKHFHTTSYSSPVESFSLPAL